MSLLLLSSATRVDRLEMTLAAIGWPTVEAAISTLLCFVPVAFHPDYTPSVFGIFSFAFHSRFSSHHHLGGHMWSRARSNPSADHLGLVTRLPVCQYRRP
jgi:hypothetical protein